MQPNLSINIFLICVLVLAVLIPIAAFMFCYPRGRHSMPKKVMWGMITIVTWPLIPLYWIQKSKNLFLIMITWVSIIGLLISCFFIVYNNLDELKQRYEKVTISSVHFVGNDNSIC